ncbi:hypothetical protein Kpho02_78100 [Kitasatospora phosalacinea]|uniref:Tyr recombinase domain-containing protein n=1 Tax=Kitasatospora phosalacinea TaxID=2065 RepID=A0A9W6V6P5_9ACTN|nr:hypothetical protein [Kitasatospora phosalacinea]GLW75513.1 hypothetical protein Kpho02_78100 [Kitasatospora phosalacinea]
MKTISSGSGSVLSLRASALLLLGYSCDATPMELSALNVADITLSDDKLRVRIPRQDRQFHEVLAASTSGTFSTCAAVVRSLLASLQAAGRTEGPLFVRTDGYEWVAQQASPYFDPSGRITPGTVVNLFLRIGYGAGFQFNCDLRTHSLRQCFNAADHVTWRPGSPTG